MKRNIFQIKDCKYIIEIFFKKKATFRRIFHFPSGFKRINEGRRSSETLVFRKFENDNSSFILSLLFGSIFIIILACLPLHQILSIEENTSNLIFKYKKYFKQFLILNVAPEKRTLDL